MSRQRSLLPLVFGLLGALVLGVIIVSGIGRTLDVGRDYEPQRLAPEQVTRLRVDVPLGQVQLTCDPGTKDFVLTQENVRQQWRLEKDGDTVKLERPEEMVTLIIEIGSISFGSNEEKVELAIPQHLCEGALDAELTASAGSLQAEGTYDELTLDTSAGDIKFTGTARTLQGDTSAGSTVLDVAGADQVTLDTSAGSQQVKLSQVPTKLTTTVSAGDVEVALPPANYVVEAEVSAGDFENQLTLDSAGKTSQVDVQISAGNVVLKSAK